MPEHTATPALRVLPDRFERTSPTSFMLWLIVLGFFAWSVNKTGVSFSDLWGGIPQMTRLVGEMLPPSTARLEAVGWALLETFQMAFVGTVVGVLLSVPIAVLATPHLSPHPLVYHAARNLIAFFRTVPDLVWALLFVVSVGLGPFAGTLAIVIDKIGFCGRFFAEAMEEVDRGPQEALKAMAVGHPRMAFIDIGMPVMNGYELAAQIRASDTFAGVILIALTGCDQVPEAGCRATTGFDHHLVKPVAIPALVRLLASLERGERTSDTRPAESSRA